MLEVVEVERGGRDEVGWLVVYILFEMIPIDCKNSMPFSDEICRYAGRSMIINGSALRLSSFNAF